MQHTHFRTCHLCEAMCGVALEVVGDKIISVRGDKDDPFSRGHICPKAVGLKDVHEDPDRLTLPQLREGSTFRPIPWDEAFDIVATRLHTIRKEHGANSVGFYQGNPTVHNYGSLLFGQLLSGALRTRNRFSATSVDQLPHMFAGLMMFGHQLLLPVPDLDRTNYLLMLGANPVASNGSLMTAPDVARRLKAIRERGGKVVVIDPRRTETAEIASEHHFIRPGADALFLFAIVNTLFAERYVRLGRLEDFTDGVDAVRNAAQAFSPESVESQVGISALQMRTLAREFATSPTAVCYGRVGVSTQEFGGLACWLVNVINVLTGNLDRPGGALFPKPAADIIEMTARLGQRGHFDKGQSRVRRLSEFGGEYPVSILAEEMETEGKGQIRAFVTSAGNPVLSTPNGRRLETALGRLDFMVSIDIYRNETTRHAHVILPPTFSLEHDHYDLAFHGLAIRNTAKYSLPLFPRGNHARHDWEIFLSLATALASKGGKLAEAQARVKDSVLRRIGPDGILDALVRIGPYGDKFNPLSKGLTLAKLRAQPHGIDLGPLASMLPERLFTHNKRIDVAPDRLLADVARLAAVLASPGGARVAQSSLLLIGRRDLRSNNSWMHNTTRLVKGRDRCTLHMHPDDAASRGLEKGSRVRITSRVGDIEAALEIVDSVMPGVVSLPHGWGHHREGTKLRVAEAHPGVSINDITDETRLDALTGNAAFSGVHVEVGPAAESRVGKGGEHNAAHESSQTLSQST